MQGGEPGRFVMSAPIPLRRDFDASQLRSLARRTNNGPQVDQAGWHMSTRLVVPANITIILLPPKCPELNPVENVWQFMRENWLSNRVFKSYDDLVDHCCAAWNRLVDQPWRIMSIG